MWSPRTFFAFLMLTQNMGRPLQWVPSFQGPAPIFQISSRFPQSYGYEKGLWIMKPPSPERSFGLSTGVDFTKPKTQSFYRAALIHPQEPVYEFRYKVHDPKEENYQEKSETRVGDSVRGYYSVQEPNGYVRLVKYTSDKNGFRTQVSHYHHHQDTEDVDGGFSFTMTRHLI